MSGGIFEFFIDTVISAIRCQAASLIGDRALVVVLRWRKDLQLLISSASSTTLFAVDLTMMMPVPVRTCVPHQSLSYQSSFYESASNG